MGWGRRTRETKAGPRGSSDRSSFGDTHVNEAIIRLNAVAAQSAAVQTHYGKTYEETISMLFDPDTIARARAARGIAEPGGAIQNYNLGQGRTLSVCYDEERHPLPIRGGMFRAQPNIGPLLAYLNDLERVYLAFEEVKAVLKWLNRNATPGAVRYYWPSAMKLTKDAPVWEKLQEVPSRYTQPEGITDWLQVLKDSAATVSGMLMLPNDAKAVTRDKLFVQFAARRVEVSSTYGYTTDAISFNIK